MKTRQDKTAHRTSSNKDITPRQDKTDQTYRTSTVQGLQVQTEEPLALDIQGEVTISHKSFAVHLTHDPGAPIS